MLLCMNQKGYQSSGLHVGHNLPGWLQSEDRPLSYQDNVHRQQTDINQHILSLPSYNNITSYTVAGAKREIL